MIDVVLLAGMRVLELYSNLWQLTKHSALTPLPTVLSGLTYISPPPASSQSFRKKPGTWGDIPWLLLVHPKYPISWLILTWMLLLFSSPDLGETRCLTVTLRKLCCSPEDLPLPPFTAPGPITSLEAARVEKQSAKSSRKRLTLRKSCRTWQRCISVN